MNNVLLIAIGIGYLLGAIPFGLLLTKFAGLGDIRDIGSGNIGATNVLRTGNRWLAAATLLLDGGKAAVAVLIVRSLFPELPLTHILAGVAAFVGHVFPIWLRFKGGKGVATYIGIMLAINWVVGIIFCAVWLVIAFTRRMSSLSALTAAATAPIFSYIFSGMELAVAAAIMSLFLFWTHRENIKRLITGDEPTIGGKAAN